MKTYLHISATPALYMLPMISDSRRHVYGRALICVYRLCSGVVALETRRQEQTRLASRTFGLLRVSPSSSPVVGNRRKLTVCRPLAAPRSEVKIVIDLKAVKPNMAHSLFQVYCFNNDSPSSNRKQFHRSAAKTFTRTSECVRSCVWGL